MVLREIARRKFPLKKTSRGKPPLVRLPCSELFRCKFYLYDNDVFIMVEKSENCYFADDNTNMFTWKRPF